MSFNQFFLATFFLSTISSQTLLNHSFVFKFFFLKTVVSILFIFLICSQSPSTSASATSSLFWKTSLIWLPNYLRSDRSSSLLISNHPVFTTHRLLTFLVLLPSIFQQTDDSNTNQLIVKSIYFECHSWIYYLLGHDLPDGPERYRIRFSLTSKFDTEF